MILDENNFAFQAPRFSPLDSRGFYIFYSEYGARGGFSPRAIILEKTDVINKLILKSRM